MSCVFLNSAFHCKAVYFWYYAAYVSFASFLPVYYADRGLSEVQVGLINALQRWLAAPATFAWAALADLSGAHRAILLGTLASAVGLRTMFLLSGSFEGILALATAAKVLSCAVNVVMDAVVMSVAAQAAEYGRYRLWGTIGYGVSSMMTGYLMSSVGMRCTFFIQAILSAPCLVHGALLGAGQRQTAKGRAGGGGSWRELAVLARRSEVAAFLSLALAMGCAVGTVDAFLLLHLEQMGASGALMGLGLTVASLSETLSYQCQGWLLERLGVTRVLSLAQVSYALVLAMYAALPVLRDVRWVLLVELLRGAAFACGWGSGTVNCRRLAPPTLTATLQGAYRALYYGVGCGLGSLLGGWVGSRLGLAAMYAWASTATLSCCFFSLGLRYVTGVHARVMIPRPHAD